MVVAGFLLSIASNFAVVATGLVDERLSLMCNEMFPYHLSALGSLALVLLCQKVLKEFVGQQIMVRAAPKMLPWASPSRSRRPSSITSSSWRRSGICGNWEDDEVFSRLAAVGSLLTCLQHCLSFAYRRGSRSSENA